LNGGGQIKYDNNIKSSKDRLFNITKLYQQIKINYPYDDESFLFFFKNLKNDNDLNLHTLYNSIEKININPLTIKW
jgi:hypothetical protein